MASANSSPDKLIAAAVQAHQAGRLDEAERLALQALSIDGSSSAAQYVLGIVYARKGDPLRAAEMLEKVLRSNPQSYEALISLSGIYRENGKSTEAVSLAQRAAKIQPAVPQSYNNLGRCYLAARQLDDAVSAFEKAIKFHPRFSAAFFNLGKAKQLQGKDGEAAAAFSQAAEITPNRENMMALGQALLTVADFQSALTCGHKCVEMFPDSPAAHLLLCGALTEASDFERASHELSEAIRLDTFGAESMQIAIRQRPLGFIDEANANLRRAIELNPRLVSAYDALIQNHRVTESDRNLVSQMRSLLEENRLSPSELISIHYGLGKALEDLGEFEDSMGHYDEANRLTLAMKYGPTPFNRENYVAYVDKILETFTPIGPIEGASDSSLPILIIGMMRSGTTLAEQILSSHPNVAAAGEQLFWSLNWPRAAAGDGKVVAELGQEYLNLLISLGLGSERVTDKMPGNYMFAGLIHQAVPNARFIHVRRSPIDNCLSIWATPNHMPHEGGHDKAAIVFVYKQYLRIVERWRSVLPADRFLEIDYEEIVSDQEKSTRRLVEFCGLPWNDRCLRPQENKRTVLTPSAWQVRQPVYRTSVERWRKFENYLGDFQELLELRHGDSPRSSSVSN